MKAGKWKLIIFLIITCKIVRATDVACKGYKRKRSESVVTTKNSGNHHFLTLLRLRL